MSSQLSWVCAAQLSMDRSMYRAPLRVGSTMDTRSAPAGAWPILNCSPVDKNRFKAKNVGRRSDWGGGRSVRQFGLELEPHPQRHQATVNGRTGTAQRLLPYDELIDVRPLHVRWRPPPPVQKGTDITTVVCNG